MNGPNAEPDDAQRYDLLKYPEMCTEEETTPRTNIYGFHEDREIAGLQKLVTELKEKISALKADLAIAPNNVCNMTSTLGPKPGGSLSLDRRLGIMHALYDIELALHDVKLQALHTLNDIHLAEHDMTYNGGYIWKIDEFSRRHHDAVIGKTPSLYSPPFYVGRYGYKVCARVYPNGEGMVKGTHLSLFLVIMKGYYDALLPWPFRQKVTFKLQQFH